MVLMLPWSWCDHEGRGNGLSIVLPTDLHFLYVFISCYALLGDCMGK
jgi:hypothetical protein